MGWFDETLVILKEEQERNHFLKTFHEKLNALAVTLDIDDDEFICFNDTRNEEEKDLVDLSQDLKTEDVLKTLCQWPGLGILSYRHPNFSHYVSINYHTWNDDQIKAFVIGFNGKEVAFGTKEEKSLELILQISNLVDYECVVGSIYDDVNIEFSRDLSDILKHISQTEFKRIDKRKHTTNII